MRRDATLRSMSWPRFRSGLPLTLAVMAAAWLAGPTVCQASLIYDFSFNGDSSNPGTVTGKIILSGIANNNSTAADAVVIDSDNVAKGFPYALPYTIDSSAPNRIIDNSFTVRNFTITSYDFSANNFGSGTGLGTYSLILHSGSINELKVVTGTTFNVENQSGISGITFTLVNGPTTVPEPSALALLGTALAGLFLFRSRTHRRDRQLRRHRPEAA